MVTFLLPRSQTLDIAECPKHIAMVRDEKEPLRINFHRTSSKSPERVRRHRSDPEPKSSSRNKSPTRNSWFRSITSSFMPGTTSPRSGNESDSSSSSSSPLDTPSTHVRRRSRSLVDSCSRVFASQSVDVDPRLPDHMRRPELQLRRIHGRDLSFSSASSKDGSSRSSSAERSQKYPLWWSV